MGNDSVKTENHVTAMALLHPFTIEFHAKGDVISTFQFADFLEFSNRSRKIERLGDFPRMSFGLALALQVAGGEVNAHGDGIVIL